VSATGAAFFAGFAAAGFAATAPEPPQRGQSSLLRKSSGPVGTRATVPLPPHWPHVSLAGATLEVAGLGHRLGRIRILFALRQDLDFLRQFDGEFFR
jgi:hypothetical protein